MTTRRTFLGGIAALPVLAGPAALAATTNPDADLIAKEPEVEAAMARLDAACTRLGAAETLKFAKLPSPDMEAADAAEEAASAAWGALRDEIVDMPARTIAGLAVKVRISDPMDDRHMAASIAADILAMAKGGAA